MACSYTEVLTYSSNEDSIPRVFFCEKKTTKIKARMSHDSTIQQQQENKLRLTRNPNANPKLDIYA